MNIHFLKTVFALLAIGSVVGISQAQEVRGRTIHSGVIVNVGSRLCVELQQASAQEGVRIQQSECRDAQGGWDVVQQDNNEFAIVNRRSGRVLDVQNSSSEDGATVQQWAWNESAAQRWRLEANVGGDRKSVV